MSIKRFMKWPYVIPIAIVAAPVVLGIFIVVGGGVVMLLWNWLLPPLFGWSTITLLQGFGLLALCRILFGGIAGGSGGGGRHRSKHMTVEERDRFRGRMRDRFCGAASDELTDANAAP